jgi:hypothetical protein
VVTGADDGGGLHACVGPTSSSCADGDVSSSDPMSCISLFKNTIVITSYIDVSMSVATMAQ